MRAPTGFSTPSDACVVPPPDRKLLQYQSGHRNNVFQARAMPGSNDATIVTCAADGQVTFGSKWKPKRQGMEPLFEACAELPTSNSATEEMQLIKDICLQIVVACAAGGRVG